MAARVAAVEAASEDLEHQVRTLQSLLLRSLTWDPAVPFDRLRRGYEEKPFAPGDLGRAGTEPRLADFLPLPPTGLASRLPKARREHEAAIEAGKLEYQRANATYARLEDERKAKLAAARAEHERAMAREADAVEKHNAELSALEAGYKEGATEAVINYFALVLEHSRYPEGFPQTFRLAFVPESRQLVVEYDLPPFDIVPAVGSYKYVKSTNKVSETARPATQRRALYESVVAQVALRTVREVFAADRAGAVETLVFNGHVRSIDRGTGQSVHPCLVTLRVTKDVFSGLELSQVDPAACLKALNAGVSKHPSELAPVRPVLEFSMVDPRFVEEEDVLGGLDQRPNLMDLSPTEFESLITNLFTKMGLETRQTRPSRDGGVDCVAYDPRPILGGKVVIQAKRYKNTVGVSAVRDLFGTVHNEGASKGILVTTSGYGKATFEFAEGKPLELISGSNLLYLLAEHAGIEAKIEPPEDWEDPAVD